MVFPLLFSSLIFIISFLYSPNFHFILYFIASELLLMGGDHSQHFSSRLAQVFFFDELSTLITLNLLLLIISFQFLFKFLFLFLFLFRFLLTFIIFLFFPFFRSRVELPVILVFPELIFLLLNFLTFLELF